MKLESMACAATWLLMNALMVMLAFETLSPFDHTVAAPTSHHQARA